MNHTNSNTPITSDNTSYYDNGAYINGDDDEPPNYYEAVLIKNRISNLLLNKNNTRDENSTVIESVNEFNVNSLTSEEIIMSGADYENNTLTDSTNDSQVSSSLDQSTANDIDIDASTSENQLRHHESLNEDEEATLNDATAISLNRTVSVENTNNFDFSQDSLDRIGYRLSPGS